MKLWKNGIFHTMISEDEVKYQLATHQGVIIGFDEQVQELDYDEIIDLHGHHVYPGFVDAHLHLLGYGQKLARPNLKNLKNKVMVIEILKQNFDQKPLFAEGYFDCGITKIELNQISSVHPILLRHNDYHSVTVNDAVLKLINQNESNGILTEEIAELAMHTFPIHTHQMLIQFLKQSINHLYQYGITGGHSDDLFYYHGLHDTLLIYDQVLMTLPFRAHLLVHHKVLDDYIKSDRVAFDQSPYLQIGAVKMFYDGTISSKTAWMIKPYKDTHTQGIRIHTIKTFNSMIQEIRTHGLTAAIHVIGDLGLIEVLNILKEYPPQKGQHDRLIHTPWMDDQALRMMKGMPISIDIQPQFLSSDLPWALDYFSNPPQYAFPWKSLLKQQINLAGSSDAPIEIPNPLLGIYAAIERQSDHDQKNYFTKESLSRFEAIKLYTSGANYSTMDHRRGFLKIGSIADFSIFTEDLMKTPIENLRKNLIYSTIIDEKIVYQKE